MGSRFGPKNGTLLAGSVARYGSSSTSIAGVVATALALSA